MPLPVNVHVRNMDVYIVQCHCILRSYTVELIQCMYCILVSVMYIHVHTLYMYM